MHGVRHPRAHFLGEPLSHDPVHRRRGMIVVIEEESGGVADRRGVLVVDAAAGRCRADGVDGLLVRRQITRSIVGG